MQHQPGVQPAGALSQTRRQPPSENSFPRPPGPPTTLPPSTSFGGMTDYGAQPRMPGPLRPGVRPPGGLLPQHPIWLPDLQFEHHCTTCVDNCESLILGCDPTSCQQMCNNSNWAHFLMKASVCNLQQVLCWPRLLLTSWPEECSCLLRWLHALR